MIGSTRTFARLLRWNHHGIPAITQPITAICGSGFALGPMAVAAASHPPVTVTHHPGVAAFDGPVDSAGCPGAGEDTRDG